MYWLIGAAVAFSLTGQVPRADAGLLGLFTQSALRSVFFARASVDGNAIEVRHLASGIARSGNDLTRELLSGKRLELPDGPDLDREVPFSHDCRRALRSAREEADRFGHSYVGPEHLLLGILRENFIIEGLTVDAVRELVRTRSQAEAPTALDRR